MSNKDIIQHEEDGSLYVLDLNYAKDLQLSTVMLDNYFAFEAQGFINIPVEFKFEYKSGKLLLNAKTKISTDKTIVVNKEVDPELLFRLTKDNIYNTHDITGDLLDETQIINLIRQKIVVDNIAFASNTSYNKTIAITRLNEVIAFANAFQASKDDNTVTLKSLMGIIDTKSDRNYVIYDIDTGNSLSVYLKDVVADGVVFTPTHQSENTCRQLHRQAKETIDSQFPNMDKGEMIKHFISKINNDVNRKEMLDF